MRQMPKWSWFQSWPHHLSTLTCLVNTRDPTGRDQSLGVSAESKKTHQQRPYREHFVRLNITVAPSWEPFGIDGKSDGSEPCVWGSTGVRQWNELRRPLLLFWVKPGGRRKPGDSLLKWDQLSSRENQKLLKHFVKLVMWSHSGTQTQGRCTDLPKAKAAVLQRKNC